MEVTAHMALHGWFLQCSKISEQVIWQRSHFSHFNYQWAQYHLSKGKAFIFLANLLNSYLLGCLGYFLHQTPFFSKCALDGFNSLHFGLQLCFLTAIRGHLENLPEQCCALSKSIEIEIDMEDFSFSIEIEIDIKEFIFKYWNWNWFLRIYFQVLKLKLISREKNSRIEIEIDIEEFNFQVLKLKLISRNLIFKYWNWNWNRRIYFQVLKLKL